MVSQQKLTYFFLNMIQFVLHENESTYIPPETKHRLENAGDDVLEIIEVHSGSYLGEDDIVRYDDDFGR